MAKSHKIILLALIALILLVSNTLAEAQGLFPDPPPSSSSKKTPDPPPTDPPPPPPITPPPKKSPPTPPPPPKTTDPKIPDPPPTPKTPDPPPKTPDPPPKSEPIIPPTPPPIISTPTPVLPPPTFSPVITPSTPTQSPPTNTAPFSNPKAGQPISCSAPNDCDSYGMFCNLSLLICQPKGTIGDKCASSNDCSNDFICNRSICQYRDNGTNLNKKIESNNIKKAAITGAIIVGVFIISGIIFFANSCYRRRKGRKGNVITSSAYSTDDGTDPIYPFIERSNSFSNKNNNNKNNNNNNIPTSHAPTTNQYDPLPPTGNGGFMGPRQGYYNNYYNDEYSGAGYMRQNDNQLRTRNILQQTRGNVMIAPHLPHVAPPPPPPPPHLPPHVPLPHLQNYNWNYGVVPGVPPAKKPLMMNQGQELLFPVPPVERNYGHNPLPNNTNIEDKKSGISHNSPQEDTVHQHQTPQTQPTM